MFSDVKFGIFIQNKKTKTEVAGKKEMGADEKLLNVLTWPYHSLELAFIKCMYMNMYSVQ